MPADLEFAGVSTEGAIQLRKTQGTRIAPNGVLCRALLVLVFRGSRTPAKDPPLNERKKFLLIVWQEAKVKRDLETYCSKNVPVFRRKSSKKMFSLANFQRACCRRCLLLLGEITLKNLRHASVP